MPTPSVPPSSRGPAPELAQARSVIESKFLQLGKELESAVTLVGAQIAALDQLAQALDGGAVDAAVANLSEAASELNGLAAVRRDERGAVQGLTDAARHLYGHIEAMQQTLRYLRVFAINIKVTAGGLPGASELFDDFSREVLSAIEEGRSQLMEFARELEQLTRGVASATAHETELERRCAQLLPAVPRQLTADAGSLAQHHKQVAALAAEIGQVARSLQSKVGGALAGLQIGDTTRQRVEHVETALGMIARAEAQGTLQAGEAAIAHAMLSAQLEDAATSFDRDVERLSQHLAGVAADAQLVLQMRGTARGGGREDNTGILARLEASLGDAISLIADLEGAEAAAKDVLGAAQATATGLARRIDSIRGIKTSINQMALNAHLKCTRLGEAGRPLSVIAIELRVSAEELGDTADAAEAILGRLADAGERGLQGAHASPAATVGTLLQAAAAPIREAETRARSDFASLAGECEAVVSSLQQATSRLNFKADVSEILMRTSRSLCEAPELHAGDGSRSAGYLALMDEVARLYTMARERTVHGRFLPTPEARPAAA